MTLLLCLVIKHFICDFPLQASPWMYKNKGTYGHLGGVAHAAIHGQATAIILTMLAPKFVLLALADAVVHYHIDWAKMKIGAVYNLRPDNSEWFWILLGLDQLLHYLTYFAIVALCAAS